MSDPYRRDAASAGQADPLAELARLIGQNDPFADLGRTQRPAATAHGAADWHGGGAEPAQPVAEEAYHEPAYRGSHAAGDARYGAAHAGAACQQPHDDGAQYQPDQQAQADSYPHDQHAHDMHAQGGYEPQALHADAPQATEHGYEPQAYEAAYDQHDYAYRPHQAYTDDPHAAAYDPAPVRRRGGLVAVMGVVALAVVGTAGAYGYRSMFGTAGSAPSTAPVIKAAETPNKVQVASVPDSSKPIQDRLPDRPQAERVVPREEQPLDVRTTSSAGNPNIVIPRLAPPNTAPASSNPSAASVLPQVQASAGPSITAEPKKIRTLAIREDANGAPRAQTPPPSPTRSAAPPASPAPAAATASADPSPFPSATRAAARPETSANGPLSLAPANGNAPAAAARKTAAVTPADRAAPGSYVQVSSRKTESEAQNAFRTLQGKYPGVLGGKSAVIRRADLGDKGVFFRAMVGPFASTDQASQLCSSLKAAGGDCVVQRN